MRWITGRHSRKNKSKGKRQRAKGKSEKPRVTVATGCASGPFQEMVLHKVTMLQFHFAAISSSC